MLVAIVDVINLDEWNIEMGSGYALHTAPLGVSSVGQRVIAEKLGVLTPFSVLLFSM